MTSLGHPILGGVYVWGKGATLRCNIQFLWPHDKIKNLLQLSTRQLPKEVFFQYWQEYVFCGKKIATYLPFISLLLQTAAVRRETEYALDSRSISSSDDDEDGFEDAQMDGESVPCTKPQGPI